MPARHPPQPETVTYVPEVRLLKHYRTTDELMLKFFLPVPISVPFKKISILAD